MSSRHRRRRAAKSPPQPRAEEAPHVQAGDHLPSMSVLDMCEWVADNDPLSVFPSETPDEPTEHPSPSPAARHAVAPPPATSKPWVDSAMEFAQYASRRTDRFRRELPSLGRQIRREYGEPVRAGLRKPAGMALGIAALAAVALVTVAALNSLGEGEVATRKEPSIPPPLAENRGIISLPTVPAEPADTPGAAPETETATDNVDAPPATTPQIAAASPAASQPTANQQPQLPSNQRAAVEPDRRITDRTDPVVTPTPPRQPAATAAASRPAGSGTPTTSTPTPVAQPQVPVQSAPQTARVEPPSREPEASADVVPRPTATAGVIAAEAAPVVVPVPPSAPAPAPAASLAAVSSPNTLVPPAGRTAAIESVLDRYEIAFSMLDAQRAKAVWPTVNQRNLERAFDSLENQTFDLGACDIDVGASRAVASCQGTARYTPKVGSRKVRTERRQWTFQLTQRGQDWSIESVNSR